MIVVFSFVILILLRVMHITSKVWGDHRQSATKHFIPKKKIRINIEYPPISDSEKSID